MATATLETRFPEVGQAVQVGIYGAALVRLPLDDGSSTQTEVQPETGSKADENDASQGDE